MSSVDDADSIQYMDLNFLTGKLREIASNTLPKDKYGIMTQESIVDRMGSQERAEKECREATCLADLGRKISADYIAQGRIGRFSGMLALKVELYNSKSGNLVGTFNETSGDLFTLVTLLDNKAPDMFRKILEENKAAASPFQSGISSLKMVDSYESDFGNLYLASVNSEPQGAALSFDGIPDDKCSRTPCKTERPEGDVRIIARLEQYETADTMVSIKQNNQNIAIILKPKFGVLEIKPAYLDGIGENKQWDLTINDEYYSFGEIRLSPSSYAVKLNHECYENIGFEVGLQKGKREVFDMSEYIKLKKGGLVLRAEQVGEPASEPVFVNGEQVGETPFSGSIPLCANIEIGKNREKVEVDLKHNDKVEHVVHETKEQRMEREQRELQEARKKEWEEKLKEKKKEEENNWLYSGKIGFGVPFMLNIIDPVFSIGGFQVFMNFEYFKPKYDFFRIGWDLNVGGYSIKKSAVKKIHPNIDSSFSDGSSLISIGAFARLYPANFMYLSGGSSFGRFGGYEGKTENGDRISGQSTMTVIFPVGGGLIFSSDGSGTFLEALYNITMLKKGYGGYWSFNIGFKGTAR